MCIRDRLKDELRMGVMEADIDSDVDAAAIAGAGVRSIQLHTGGIDVYKRQTTTRSFRSARATAPPRR